MISKLFSIFRGKEAKNASWLILGRVLQMLLSFVVSIFTARFLGPSNFGLNNYASAYVAFFTAICSLGINSVIVKDIIENPDEQGLAIGSTLVLRGIASVLSSILIISVSVFIDRNDPLAISVVALSSVSLIFHIFETFNFWFQSRYQSKITAIATLVAYIITFAYKILLLVLRKDVRWFAFANSIDYIVLAIALFVFYKKHNGQGLKFAIT
jgi:O-antigen/teichoic acid export membrane protein